MLPCHINHSLLIHCCIWEVKHAYKAPQHSYWVEGVIITTLEQPGLDINWPVTGFDCLTHCPQPLSPTARTHRVTQVAAREKGFATLSLFSRIDLNKRRLQSREANGFEHAHLDP